MTQFLAVIRRFFLGGMVSLIVCFFVADLRSMIGFAINPNSIQSIFSIFFLTSPILFVLSTIISAAYIRKYGQFALAHQEKPFISTVFLCVGHDIVFPFKNTIGFFGAIFNKNALGRKKLIARFVGTVLLIISCVVGVLLLKSK